MLTVVQDCGLATAKVMSLPPSDEVPVRLRSALPLALVAALSVAAAPTVTFEDGSSGEEVPEPKICDNQFSLEVLPPGALDVTVPAPSFLLGNERETRMFLVDLGSEDEPAYEDTTARLDGEMTWTVVVNDYDMILGPVTTEAYQPFDPAVETATITVGHCAIVEIGAYDYLAPAPVEEDLTISTTLTRND